MKRLLTAPFAVCLICILAVVSTQPAAALDDAHWKQANAAIDKGIDYLRTTQAEDGSWLSRPGPGVTGLVVTAMLSQPDIDSTDPAVAKAIAYILSKQQDDGSFKDGKDGILANYNTAICLSAVFASVSNDARIAEAIKKGQQFLMGNQWKPGMKDEKGNVIDEQHPYVGGYGYDGNGRPDLSNTQMALQALHDTGVDCNDPVFQRAPLFLNNLQAHEGNDTLKDKIEPTGGFVYVPERGGRGESLRIDGGLTYGGFKSLLYANLKRDDPRIQAVMKWVENNYSMNSNPGMGDEINKKGLFYYYLAMSRGLNAWGSTTLTVKQGDQTVKRDWANDLIDELVKIQNKDGSWKNTERQWMEDQPDLATAYAIIALHNAID